MSEKSRTQNSIRNILFSMAGYFFVLILQLVNRNVFVKMLSVEYLGLNGLFGNILSMLAFSELGIGTAIIFSLYKPVAEKNEEKVCALMNLYRKLYTIIGCVVLLTGALVTPFLQYLIKDMPDIPYIRIYFLLYVLNSGISYFYTYKRSLIICNQEEYISTTTTMIASALVRLLQIVVLMISHSYLLFLIVQVVVTRLENICISKIADKKFPYLKKKNKCQLSKDDKQEIKKNVAAVVIHKFGSVVVNATDSLIISKILGLASSGLYSNYILVTDTVMGILSKIFNSVTGSIGNLVAKEGRKKVEEMFNNILWMNFWLVCFSSTCIYCLLQNFIVLWLGEKYLLDYFSMSVIILCFYFNGIRKTILTFRNAVGLFWEDRYKPIFEVIINLVCSIPLTYIFGVAGVKLGTVISTITVTFWLEAYILYKYYFEKSCWLYIFKQIYYITLTILICVLTLFLSKS